MDYLYYSNYCKHSAKLLQHLAKTGAINKLNCVCVDRRKRHPQTGQTIILTETGAQHPLPISVNSVPTVLLVSDKYRVVVGQDIYELFPNSAKENVGSGGEPEGFKLSSSGPSIGESYDNFGAGGNAVLMDIPAEPYRSKRIGEEVSLNSLVEQRDADLASLNAGPVHDMGIMPGNMSVRSAGVF